MDRRTSRFTQSQQSAPRSIRSHAKVVAGQGAELATAPTTGTFRLLSIGPRSRRRCLLGCDMGFCYGRSGGWNLLFVSGDSPRWCFPLKMAPPLEPLYNSVAFAPSQIVLRSTYLSELVTVSCRLVGSSFLMGRELMKCWAMSHLNVPGK